MNVHRILPSFFRWRSVLFVLEAVSDIDVWDSKLNANLPAIKFEYTFEIGEIEVSKPARFVFDFMEE